MPRAMQALIMAGFRAEEYAVARTTLDQLGADSIKVLPATEDMLQVRYIYIYIRYIYIYIRSYYVGLL